jgi:EH domain-containing protein 1
VIQTPEVMRIYVGSFVESKRRDSENEELLQREERDLLKDIQALPKNNLTRKINEIVKRARLAKTHSYIMSYFYEQMPAFFGKSKQKIKVRCHFKEVLEFK